MVGDPARSPFDPIHLRRSGELRRMSIEPRDGAWHPVRHGVWMAESKWALLDPIDRHAALVHAASLTQRGKKPLLFNLQSSAAIWGLPRIERWPGVVRHLVVRRGQRGNSLIRPHLGPESESVERQGLLVTPVARTVVDLARFDTIHNSVAAADYALRHGLCSRAELTAEIAGLPRGSRGLPRARTVVDLADPLSMSPGESLSRTKMFLLRLPRPQLQVAYHDDRGLIGAVDFNWDGVIGEFDGRTKYAVPEGATPEEAAQVLWQEKQREDRLRRHPKVTDFARWVWADAMTQRRLLVVLTAAGITPDPRNTWIDLGSARTRE